jgi:hypothetical protein
MRARLEDFRRFVFEHGLALFLGTWMVLLVTMPVLSDVRKAGFHDWDSATVYRGITQLSILRYHEFPFWHPYLCGGFAAWGYSEGATNLVSVFAPFYFVMPMLSALRVELIGSALISFYGTYVLAGRYTTLRAVQLLVAGIVTLNGRWAMQLAVGHSWYFGYAWIPLMMYCFLRALEEKRRDFAHLSGAILALIIYIGGIYPLPHGALLLVCLCIVHCATKRDLGPFKLLTISALTGIGLAAPKLLPVADVMQKFSRKIESLEVIDPVAALLMLVGRNQSLGGGPTPVPAYGWHEWGFYIGIGALFALLFGAAFERSARGIGLTLIGLLFWVLSLGNFGEASPWALLHRLPVFSSQHVPSRFMAVAVLVGLLVFASAFERRTAWLRARMPLTTPLLYPVAMLLLADVGEISQKALAEAFNLSMPQTAFRAEFKQLQTLPYNYSPAGAWAGPSYPAMLNNDGFVGCYSVPDKADPKGAIPEGADNYKGTAYVEGPGSATLVAWSPNSATVAYEGLAHESAVLYNMNHEASWRADNGPAENIHHAVGIHPRKSSGQVVFRYRPRTWNVSLLLCALTLAATAWSIREERARKRAVS